MLKKEHSNEPAILSSWKEVAAYLGKGVRTVQRWERLDQLPVRRLSGTSKIIVHRGEIDHWLRSRAIRSATSGSSAAQQSSNGQNSELIARAQCLRASHFALRQSMNGSLDALIAECRRLTEMCASMAAQSTSSREADCTTAMKWASRTTRLMAEPNPRS